MPRKIKSELSLAELLALSVISAVITATLMAACAHEPTVGGDGVASSTVKLIHFQGSGSVSMEVYGIPIEAAVSSDPECSRAIVRIHGVPVLRESLCSPQPAPEASQPESHVTPKE
jgi:hypothetical protein